MAPTGARGTIRTCCGCGLRDVQSALIRVTWSVAGKLTPDLRRRGGGRGAYLHSASTCWEEFVRGRAYVQSLRRKVLREERRALIERLRTEMAGRGEASPR